MGAMIQGLDTGIIHDIDTPFPYVGFSPLDLALFLLTLIVGFFAIKFTVQALRKAMLKANAGEILTEFTARIARLLMFIFLLGIALAFLGLTIGPALLSLSVVMGFVLGFALGDTLGNIAAGFMIAISKPFKPGDYVKVNGETGTIKAVGISYTEMDTPDNKHVIIPNKAVWGNNIINYSYNPIRRVDMEVGVSYSANLDHVVKTTMDLIKSDSRVLEDPEPQVAVKEMGDSAVVLVVRPWTATESYWDIFFEFQKKLKETYDREDIAIPFPQMDLHLVEDLTKADSQ